MNKCHQNVHTHIESFGTQKKKKKNQLRVLLFASEPCVFHAYFFNVYAKIAILKMMSAPNNAHKKNQLYGHHVGNWSRYFGRNTTSRYIIYLKKSLH